MVAELIGEQLAENQLSVTDVKRFCWTEVNLSMNHLIVKKLLGTRGIGGRSAGDPRDSRQYQASAAR